MNDALLPRLSGLVVPELGGAELLGAVLEVVFGVVLVDADEGDNAAVD